jgi:hypothetical protein
MSRFARAIPGIVAGWLLLDPVEDLETSDPPRRKGDEQAGEENDPRDRDPGRGRVGEDAIPESGGIETGRAIRGSG